MAEARLAPGDIVRHFKRDLIGCEGTRYLYRILHFAIDSETEEPCVVYQALYGEGLIYVRPYAMFMGKTDIAKYPAARQKWRFAKASPEEARLAGGK